MPDKRTHRGPHPEDRSLFGVKHLPALRAAVEEQSWLLTRGYRVESALTLVGNRHALTDRQRAAVARIACSDQARDERAARCTPPEQAAGAVMLIDGYNLITTIEAALGGGLVLPCRDGTFRDLASMKGTFRKVDETRPALELLAEEVSARKPSRVEILLDSPVSNSGRLARLIEETGSARGCPWTVSLVPDPDRLLAGRAELVVSADSGVLDRCGAWLNLARFVVERRVPNAWVLALEAP